MIEILELFKSIWGLLAAAVAFIVWLVRLEAGMIYNKKKIQEIESQLVKDREEAKAARAETDASLALLRSEMKEYFVRIENSIEKIIWALGDKADKRD